MKDDLKKMHKHLDDAIESFKKFKKLYDKHYYDGTMKWISDYVGFEGEFGAEDILNFINELKFSID